MHLLRNRIRVWCSFVAELRIRVWYLFCSFVSWVLECSPPDRLCLDTNFMLLRIWLWCHCCILVKKVWTYLHSKDGVKCCNILISALTHEFQLLRKQKRCSEPSWLFLQVNAAPMTKWKMLKNRRLQNWGVFKESHFLQFFIEVWSFFCVFAFGIWHWAKANSKSSTINTSYSSNLEMMFCVALTTGEVFACCSQSMTFLTGNIQIQAF